MGSRVVLATREKNGKSRGKQGNGTAAQHDSSDCVWNIFKLLEGIGEEGLSSRGNITGLFATQRSIILSSRILGISSENVAHLL